MRYSYKGIHANERDEVERRQWQSGVDFVDRLKPTTTVRTQFNEYNYPLKGGEGMLMNRGLAEIECILIRTKFRVRESSMINRTELL